ncbi:AraC family transcriptional regulator [Pseudomonas capeferrum]|uniref:AraC family transcriptional regulator n=1 Tax=Pseudomonas capeferrum TaxID=1495066 RepID=UPI0015E2F027|nr:AraC family transcriptional regulator [Pseudomonas capeferrum]MBA1203995.1 AraC family transcriptional regulator [Pseudomonas capeferrum]
MLPTHLTTLNAVSLILKVFQDERGSVDELLVGSGIGLADLDHADGRITTQQEQTVCSNAVARREDIGLHLGQRMHVSCYGMLGYALLSSATLGDALRLAMGYPALLGTLFHLRLADDGQRIWLCASEYRESAALAAFNAEFCLTSLKVICDDLLGQPLPLLGARFEHEQPGYHALYGKAFQCPLAFAAADNAFAFDRRWLEAPLPLADPITYQAMNERCRRLNMEFTGRQAWLGRIRQLLQQQLDAAPGIDGLARQMNCSSRTLRRHLHALGSSYQQLLDELRFERAKQLLAEDQMPIYRIAETLGFSETASFRHAFQRWSGVAPSHFRS